MTDDAFNESDFLSLELVAYLRHPHTGTELRDPGKVKVIEIGEKDVWMEIPPKTFAAGHFLMLGIAVKNATEKVKPFAAEAKIDEVRKLEGCDHIHLTLTQFESEHWNAFKRLFTERQRSIEEFLRAARGTE